MPTKVVAPNEGRTILEGFVQFKLFGAETGGALAIVEHVLGPGVLGAPMHTHRNEDEYSYVLEGAISVLVGDELIQAPAGTLVGKPRNIPHTFWNGGSVPARLLEIISPAGFERYFDELAQLLGESGPPDIERITALAGKYDMDMDFSTLAEIEQKYHVSIGRPSDA